MKYRELIIICAVSTMTACGSGDGDSGDSSIPTTPINITSSNATTVASSATSTRESMGTIENTSSGYVRSMVIDSSTQGGVLPATLTAFQQAYNTPVVTGGRSVSSPTDSCTSGTATIEFNDVNLNSQWDQGEGVSINYSSCSITSGTTTITLDGGISITMTTLSGDPSTGTTAGNWAFSLTVDYDDFTVSVGTTSVAVDGDVNVASSYTNPVSNASISGSSLTMTATTSTQTVSSRVSSFIFDSALNHSTSDFTWNADYNLASTQLGGSITVVTDPVFAGNVAVSPYPATGIMVITGANNSAVKLDADTGNINTVAIWLDEDGDGIFTHHSDVLWSTL